MNPYDLRKAAALLDQYVSDPGLSTKWHDSVLELAERLRAEAARLEAEGR